MILGFICDTGAAASWVWDRARWDGAPECHGEGGVVEPFRPGARGSPGGTGQSAARTRQPAPDGWERQATGNYPVDVYNHVMYLVYPHVMNKGNLRNWLTIPNWWCLYNLKVLSRVASQKFWKYWLPVIMHDIFITAVCVMFIYYKIYTIIMLIHICPLICHSRR